MIAFKNNATIALILFGLFVSARLTAQTAEEQEARLQTALRTMNRMEHYRAYQLFREAAEHEPWHPLAPFGALANRWLYDQGKYGYVVGNQELLERIDEVILDYRRRLVLDPENPELKYYIGLSNGLRARVLLAQKDWLGVLVSGYRIIRNFKAAFRENPEDPDIIIAFGVFNYYVGLSSGFMKIASWVMQLSGSKEEGLQQIEMAARHGNYSRYEARSILAYLNLYFESDYPAARRWLDSLITDFPQNPYYNFLYAEYCIRTENPVIDRYIQRIQQRLDSLDTYYRNEYVQRLRILEGSRAFLRGDYARAEEQLLTYLDNYYSELDYNLASVYLRLGKLYDVQNQRDKAVAYYQKCVALDNRSAAVVTAQKYLQSPYSPES